MSNDVKCFFLALMINFIVLAGLSILFEYFDTGDDPIYSFGEAVKNFIIALVIAGVTIFTFQRRNTPDQKQG